MKKLLSFMLTLLCATPTFAGVTDLPEMSAEGDINWYVISNTRSTSGKYLYYAGDAVGLKDSNSLTGNSLFYLTGTHDACYIHNAGTSNLFASETSWTAEGTVCSIGVTPHSSNAGLYIGFNGTYLNEKNYSVADNVSDFTTWSANDDGSIFVFSLATAPIEATIAEMETNRDANNTIMGAYRYEEEQYNSLVNALNTMNSSTGEDAASAYESANTLIASLARVMPEPEKFYIIEAPLFYNTQGENKGLLVNTDGSLGWNTIDLTNRNCYWQVEISGTGGYALKNVGTSKYVAGTSVSDSPVYGSLNALGEEQFNIVIGGVTMHANNHGNGYNENGDIVSWSGSINSASAWQFIEKQDPDATQEVSVTYNFTYNNEIKFTQTTETLIGEEWPNVTINLPFGVSASKPEGTISTDDVEDGTATKEIELQINVPFSFAADYASIEHWYYMSLKDFAHYLNYSEGATQMDLSNASSVPGDNKDAFTWGFIGDPFNGYQIVNFAAGENMILSSTTTTTDGNTGGSTFPVMTSIPVPDGNNTYWVATASTYREGVGFYLEQKGHSANKMNLRDNKLAYWNSGADGGSTFVVEERDILAEAIEAIETARLVSFGESAGQYTNPENVDLEALIAAVELAVNDSDLVGANAATKELYAAIATLSINLPQPGKFYRIQNNAGNAYLVSGTGTGRVRFSDVAENAANSIFYYTGEKLVDYTTGLYLAAGNESSFLNYTETKGEAAGVAISFIKSNAIGKLCVNYNSNRYLYSAGEGDSNGGKIENGIPSDTNYYFSITEVTELPIAYNEEFVWSTLYSPVQLGLIENKVKAYTGTLNTEDPENVTLVVTELNGSIPANTGVILGVVKSDDIVVNGYVYLPIEDNTAEEVASDLTGLFYTVAQEDAATAAEEEVYNFLFQEDTVTNPETGEDSNFGKFNLDMESDLPAFTAYLKTSSSSDETIEIADSEGNNPTGIEEITVEVEKVQGIYDLQGRRLSAPVKGINIINGKKVLVK